MHDRASQTRYNPLPAASSSNYLHRAHRPASHCEQPWSSRRWRASPIGRSASCASASARATRCRRWSRRIRSCADTRKVAAAHRSRGRGRAHRRADRRRRSRDDGRRRALQRRARRADHRHQHGLPGQEGLQRRGRLGAAAERAAGRRDRRRRRARGRRAGHAEDPHRLGSGSTATRSRIARIAEDAGIAALAVHGRTRACAFVGAGRVRHDPRGQARRSAFR